MIVGSSYKIFTLDVMLISWFSKPLFTCLLQHYNAKIADFGLAKLGPSGGKSHVTTRIMGTYGYAAPEYIATGNCIFFNLHTMQFNKASKTDVSSSLVGTL